MQYARIGSLSGGERRRLYLLRSLIHQPNLLLLDEPTNDLDIQTLAVLESYLDHFTGCLVVASHDRYFLDRTVDFMLAIEDGQLGPRYPAPYVSFVERRREEQAETPQGVDTESPRPARPDEKVLGRAVVRKLTWKEQRELEDLDARVAAFELQKKLLLDEIAKSGDNYEQLRTLSAQLESLDDDLDTALERWFELSAIAETVTGT